VSDELVECTYDAGVATVTLNRPPANILNIAMMEQINATLLGLRDHRELKVLVLRGAGSTFCGGVEIADHTRDRVGRMVQVFHRIFETMRLMDLIAIAAVDGAARGGGFELAIGCNMVVASHSATFALPQIDMGVFPALAAVVLPRATLRRKAMEWILMGEEISAQELERFGVVNRVFPDDQFDDMLQSFVGKLTAKSGPVLQLARRAQSESYYAAYEEALYKVENLYLPDLMTLRDAREGIESTLEGRSPTWHDA
jgi:cyclohexa-1,5-dienecarbonyl-CoA hydratase